MTGRNDGPALIGHASGRGGAGIPQPAVEFARLDWIIELAPGHGLPSFGRRRT
jgi:hypothetical protein